MIQQAYGTRSQFSIRYDANTYVCLSLFNVGETLLYWSNFYFCYFQSAPLGELVYRLIENDLVSQVAFVGNQNKYQYDIQTKQRILYLFYQRFARKAKTKAHIKIKNMKEIFHMQ